MDRTPPWQIGVVALVWLAVTIPSWWTYSGPWRWQTEFQLAVLGASSPLLSGTAWIVALLLLLAPLAAWHQRAQTPKQPPPDLSSLQTTSGKALLLAAMLVCLAIFFGGQALIAGEQVELAPADVAGSQASWVRVPPGDAVFEWAVGYGDDWYLPVIVDGAVQLVFTVDPLDEPTPRDLGDGSGMRVVGGLTGPVRVEWERGGLRVPLDVAVIDVRASPAQRTFLAVVMAFAAAVALSVGVWTRAPR